MSIERLCFSGFPDRVGQVGHPLRRLDEQHLCVDAGQRHGLPQPDVGLLLAVTVVNAALPGEVCGA